MDNPLDTAKGLVDGARQKDYGHPLDDFTKTAAFWTAILSPILKEGCQVTPKQIALCMIGVKLSREVNREQEDNLVDMAGYVQTAWMVDEEIKRREENGKERHPFQG